MLSNSKLPLNGSVTLRSQAFMIKLYISSYLFNATCTKKGKINNNNNNKKDYTNTLYPTISNHLLSKTLSSMTSCVTPADSSEHVKSSGVTQSIDSLMSKHIWDPNRKCTYVLNVLISTIVICWSTLWIIPSSLSLIQPPVYFMFLFLGNLQQWKSGYHLKTDTAQTDVSCSLFNLKYLSTLLWMERQTRGGWCLVSKSFWSDVLQPRWITLKNVHSLRRNSSISDSTDILDWTLHNTLLEISEGLWFHMRINWIYYSCRR